MLNRAQMRNASQRFQLWFWSALNQTQGKMASVMGAADLLCMDAPGESFEELYRWFEGLPVMRKWVGSRIYKELSAKGFEVKLEAWESSLKALRDDIMFDHLGGYKPTIMRMANEMRLLKWRESVKVVEDGFTGTTYGNCYDGYPLFSASHRTGSNTGTAAFSASALDDAVIAMRAQTDPETSDDLLIEPSHIWYHFSLEPTVSDVLDRDFVLDSTGMAGVNSGAKSRYGKLGRVPLRGLTTSGQNYWGLLSVDPSEPMKPILHRYHPGSGKFVALDRDSDEANFDRRELKYGTEYWSKTVPGMPQFIWGSTGTT